MRKKILLASLFTTISLILIHPYVFTSSTGAPIRSAGAPGENTCSQYGCHNGNDLNSGDGKLSIKILDNGTEVNDFVNGKVYTVEVDLSKADANAFGFQAAVKGSTATTGGAFATGGNTDVRKLSASYITHANPYPLSSGADKWTFQWTAPASGAKDVTFYVAGNAADGNGSNDGDFIYTTKKTLAPSPTSVDDKTLFAQNIRMYPNPVQSVLNVEFTSAENLNNKAVLQIFTVDGKLVKTVESSAKAFSGNTIYADLSGYKKGIYLAQLTVGENTIVKKILKQ